VLTDLDKLSPVRRKIYDFTNHKLFEALIMTCIVTNTMLMAVEVYPELETPEMQPWRDFKEGINILFALIFTVEAGLKIFAYRRSYFKDNWNRFDFTCVIATLIGIILKYSNSGINISSLASVIRIFRIARLFRLLKFKPLRPMNKLFASLAVSMVKLASVGVVAGLFLVLFSILGMNLFGMASQEEDTLNGHGNFKNFWVSFMTLFRASTGEAWNEIMHDLSKDESDYFRSGRWCAPNSLFNTQFKYDILKDKCLIDQPNACAGRVQAQLFWIGYTLFIGLVIMNIVVAVILEGYDESKNSDEGAIIDTCKNLWQRKYDPDHKMFLPTGTAMKFIIEAMKELQQDGLVQGSEMNIPTLEATSFARLLANIPMRLARAFDADYGDRDPRGVPFMGAVRQVLRGIAVLSNEDDQDVVELLNQCDEMKSKKVLALNVLEMKHCGPKRSGTGLTQQIAATKLQRNFRRTMSIKKARSDKDVVESTPVVPAQVSRDDVASPRVAG